MAVMTTAIGDNNVDSDGSGARDKGNVSHVTMLMIIMPLPLEGLS